MAINKQDIIKIINQYRNSRASKALPVGYKLEDFDNHVKYLTDLTAKSPSNDIEIVTPEDAQRVSLAINALAAFNNIGTVQETAEKIKVGQEKLREFSKQIPKATTSFDEDIAKKLLGSKTEISKYPFERTNAAFTDAQAEIPYAAGIRTLGDLKELQARWIRKKDYVYFPPKASNDPYYQKNPALAAELGKYITYNTETDFIAKLGQALPVDVQYRVNALLGGLKDANQKFILDKELYTSTFNQAISRIADQVKERGTLADNTLVSIADFSAREKDAFESISSWVNLPQQEVAISQVTDYIKELTQIYNTFAMPSVAESRKGQMSPEQEKALRSAYSKYDKGYKYDDLTDKEKEALDIAGKSSKLSGQQYFEMVVGRQEYEEKLKAAEALEEQQNIANRTAQRSTGQIGERSPIPALDQQLVPNAVPTPQDLIRQPEAEQAALGANVKMSKPATSRERAKTETSTSATPQQVEEVVSSSAVGGQPTNIRTWEDIYNAPLSVPSDSAQTNTIQTPAPEFETTTVTEIPTFTSTVTETGVQDGQTTIAPLPSKPLSTTDGQNITSEEIWTNIATTRKTQQFLDDLNRQDQAEAETNRVLTAEIEKRQRAQDALRASGQDLRDALIDEETFKGLDKPTTTGTLVGKFDKAVAGRLQGLRILSRGEQVYYDLVKKRQAVFTANWIKGDLIGAFADMPSLLGAGYAESLGYWIKEKASVVGDKIYDYMARKFTESRFYNIWKPRLELTKWKVRAWGKKTVIGKISIFTQNLVFNAKLKKKKTGAYIVGEAFKYLVKQAVRAFQATAQAVVTTANAAGNGARFIFKRPLINSPTALYREIFKADPQLIANKALEFVERIDSKVRIGLEKVTVTMGDVASIAKSFIKPLAAAIESLPTAGIAGAAALIGSGSIAAGVGVFAASAATNTLVKIMESDPAQILGDVARFSKYEWGPIGRAVHWMANVVRAPYVALAKRGLMIGGVKNALATGDIKALQDITKNGSLPFRKPLNIGLRAINNGLTGASIGFMIGNLTGIGGFAGAAILGTASVAGSVIKSVIDNKLVKDAATAGKINTLFKAPMWSTVNAFFDIAQLGEELAIIQNKYNGDFGEYFKNEFGNKVVAFGRLSNWISALWSGAELPLTLSRFFGAMFPRLLEGAALTAKGQIIYTSTAAFRSVAIPATLGWLTGLGVAILMGIPFGPGMMLGSLIGATTGAVLGVVVSGVVPGAQPFTGWIVWGFSTVGSTFGAWIGSLFDKAANKAMSLLNVAVNGIQALIELISILRMGIGLKNVLQLILAIGSIISTLNYMQTMNATNTCTTEDECTSITTGPQESSIAPGSTAYLSYYDLTVISSDSTTQPQNIQRVLYLLAENPSALDNAFGNKKRYIYVGQTTDTYINDQVAIVAIDQDQLYKTNDISALINLSVAAK